MSKDDYEVGYRKPPKATQFKGGQSGNPKGRPRKPRDITALINQELDATIQITENGVRKTLPVRQVFVKGLINKALKGDYRASLLVLKHFEGTPEEIDFQVELDDVAALEKFRARIAGGTKK